MTSAGPSVRAARRAIVLFFFLGAGASLFAQSFLFGGMQFPSSRMDALGGAHVALADDISTLLTNPAGFRQAEPQFSIAEVTANLAGPVFSIADLAKRVTGGGNLLTLLADPTVKALLTSLYAAGTLNGPLSFGYVGNGLGFGFFNSSGVSFTTQGTIPVVTAQIQENVELIGGYTFSIPLPPSSLSTLDLGMTLKAFAQGDVTVSQSILDLLTFLTAPNANILMTQPFVLDVGIGVDGGVLYSWNKVISVGIVGRNLYTPIMRNTYGSLSSFGTVAPALSYGIWPLDLSAGIMFSPRLGPLEEYITNLKLMLDYGDILDFLTHPATASNPLLHVGIGMELVMLRILSLRAGFDEGYFSAGLGLDLTIFHLNLTMLGSELSTEPGLRPVYNLLAGLEFRY
jgi:hypothetical protein